VECQIEDAERSGPALMKLSSLLRPVKDDLGLRIPGIYRTPCECGRVYIGQTGRSVDIRLKEHQWDIRLERPDKVIVTEQSPDQRYRIQFYFFHPRHEIQINGSHCQGGH
jgi:hypothetical protein